MGACAKIWVPARPAPVRNACVICDRLWEEEKGEENSCLQQVARKLYDVPGIGAVKPGSTLST